MSRFRSPLACAALSCVVLASCKRPYRVGDYVWVEWYGKNYPAYIIQTRGRDRYRVHFDGYDTRWDDDVSIDRIKGRIHGRATPPPPPVKIARAEGLSPRALASATRVSPYKVGDRVKVSWRGSTYSATIIEVLSPTRFRVHYSGYETAFDEVVNAQRIVGRR